MSTQKNLKPWKPGQSGNPAGRPKGSRNRLSEAFLKALADDFEEHGEATIQKAREKDAGAYLRVVASLMPKELEIRETPLENLTDDELNARAAALVRAIGADRVAAVLRGDRAAAEDEPPGGIPAVH